jgi:hypothetical protein
MKKIFLVNHSVHNCGAYQFGKRIGNIIKCSKLFDVHYLEIDNENQLISYIRNLNPDIIIYNYIDCTMPWLNGNLLNNNKVNGIIQGVIVHNTYINGFDFYLHQDPDFIEHNNDYNMLRPLLKHDRKFDKKDDVIRIGSFGFGFNTKHFDELCLLVNEQFLTEKVEIRLHLTISHFSPNQTTIQEIINKCYSVIDKPNITITFTHDFITDDEMLDFLSKNDLNIFLHKKYDTYQGISSSMDFGLSAKKPIAICRSNMFSHIYNAEPSICIESNDLKSIMRNGFGPLGSYYERWSNENFIEKFNKDMTSIIKKNINNV